MWDDVKTFLLGNQQRHSKDISFQRYLVLDILTNPERVTLTKKGNFLEKNPLPIWLRTYQVQILAFVQAWKTKKLFKYVRLVGKYAFFSCKTRL